LLGALGRDDRFLPGMKKPQSSTAFVNRLAAMTMDLIGVSSYVRRWKHASIHHNQVNITGFRCRHRHRLVRQAFAPISTRASSSSAAERAFGPASSFPGGKTPRFFFYLRHP
jgi:hypothetical protein